MTETPETPAKSGIQSMTGSGSVSGETELGGVAVECRATNGKGLSIKMRLAGECQGFEAALETYLRSRLQRGSVFATIVVTEPVPVTAVSIDLELAATAADQLQKLADSLGKTLELSDILAVPGVIPTSSSSSKSASRVSRELPADIAELVRQAVDQLIESRLAEGRATVAAMLAVIERIDAELGTVRSRAPEVVASYREKLLVRVNEFLQGRATAMEDSDVIREVAVFADRVDVAEEIQRLDSHIAKARELLQSDGAIGRNLEFLVQEMLREVNTLGSKSPDVTLAHSVVEMKSCIDKLKEQSANLA